MADLLKKFRRAFNEAVELTTDTFTHMHILLSSGGVACDLLSQHAAVALLQFLPQTHGKLGAAMEN